MLSTTRTWVTGTVVVALLLVIASWFLLIGPERAEAADTREQTVAAEEINAQLAVKLEQLEQQFVQLPAKEAELAAVRAAMPEDDALPELIRVVDGYAVDTGVTLTGFAPGTPLVPTADPAAAPVPAEGTEGTTAADPAAPPAPGGLVTVDIPVTTTVVGNFFEVESFLQRLQTGTRAHLVRGLTLTAEEPAPAGDGKPATQAGDVTMVVTGSVFLLRDAAAATPAVPATP